MLKKYRMVTILIIAVLVIPFLSSLLDFYADWLFFVETGFTAVFTTNLVAKLASGFGFGLVFLLFALTNAHFANHAKFPLRGAFPIGGNLYRIKSDDAARLAAPLSILASVALSFMAGNWGAVQWQNVLLFANEVTVGIPDPVLGKDVGFYLFSLPLLEQSRGLPASWCSPRRSSPSRSTTCAAA